VLELSVKSGASEVESFKKPMVVSIPVGNIEEYTEEELENELTAYIIDEATGEMKAVGGKYNPETKSIEFYRIHLSKYTVLKTKKSFSDLGDSKLKKEINEMLGKGILDDTDKFDPNKKVTKGEFTAWVSRAYGLDMEKYDVAFADVDKDHPYYKEIASALAVGLVTGEEGANFNPDDEIKQEEMAIILARVVEEIDGEGKVENKDAFTASAGDVADWAKDAVAQASKKNVIDLDKFDPKAGIDKENAVESIIKLYKQS